MILPQTFYGVYTKDSLIRHLFLIVSINHEPSLSREGLTPEDCSGSEVF